MGKVRIFNKKECNCKSIIATHFFWFENTYMLAMIYLLNSAMAAMYDKIATATEIQRLLYQDMPSYYGMTLSHLIISASSHGTSKQCVLLIFCRFAKGPCSETYIKRSQVTSNDCRL